MSVIKQSVGIDISQANFAACVCKRTIDNELSYSPIQSFKNEKQGFNQFLRWVSSQIESGSEVVFLMEATGVYYENLAYHLDKIKKTVHVVLPNKSRHYFSSLNLKTKTDEVDAKALSRFGVERTHQRWQTPKPIYLQLRNLTRYHVQLQEQKTALSNMKHSKEASHEVQAFILKSNQGLISQIDKHIQACLKQIKELVGSDNELNSKVQKLCTIKGIGLITVVTIIGETLGFQDVVNAKQLVSYSGYDVVQRESGTSIRGKTRISKKGNRYIRNALYFPAMVACRYNEALKETYLRIIKKKPSRMIGQVAIQRKLLTLTYTLWKNDIVFDPNYKQSSPDNKAEATLDSSIKELL